MRFETSPVAFEPFGFRRSKKRFGKFLVSVG